MDISNNNIESRQAAPGININNGAPARLGKVSRLPDGMSKSLRVAAVILLFSITVLLVAIAFSFYFGNNSESGYLQKGAFQAVDIAVGGSASGDQIYFGNIKNINDKFLVLDNVYYIPSTATSSNVNLEPLVCQVDMPYSRMIVNRSSVNWWENLQSSGQVAKAITSYQNSNTSNLSCPKTSASAAATSKTSTPTASTSTTTTTKP